MRTSSKSIITASLVLPLLLVACNRVDQAPSSSSGTSQGKQATNPSPPPAGQAPEKAPPAPADLSKNPMAPSSGAPATSEPAPGGQK